MYRPERQRAIKEKHWRELVAGESAPRKKRKRVAHNKSIGLEDLRRMHHVVKQVCQVNAFGPETEAYRLLCSLGACMGNWPRVKRRKAADLRRRYHQLLAYLDEK